ncbi:MAG TPA: redoxin domain-containing protein [Atribacterota bacterium]|nr:redoxin domain-containing protein [Atribacterota bacterium]
MTTGKQRINYTTIAILLVSAAFITIFFVISTPAIAQYKTGSPAPDFTLEALDGEIFQLNQFLNKQQHLILFFMHSEEDSSLAKLGDLITFLNDYQPRESYQIVAIMEQSQDSEGAIEKLNNLKSKAEIPLIILLDTDGKINTVYGVKTYPTVLLLRTDLYVRKAYDRFTSRQEASFYQYLKFIFTSQKSKDSGNGCDDGVYPPPPGFE